MDGYALRLAELKPGAGFEVIGEFAAGRRFAGTVGPGQAVRIFTGAPVPQGADAVVIQEDVHCEGARIVILPSLGEGTNIRPQGADFADELRLLRAWPAGSGGTVAAGGDGRAPRLLPLHCGPEVRDHRDGGLRS